MAELPSRATSASNMKTNDLIVVGGGLVGVSLAYGAARAGARVLLLDEGDDAFRASRGNFGLVWVQGKGYGLTAYTKWTRLSASLWPQLAADLMAATGVDIQLRQPGGFHFCFSDVEVAKRRARLESIRDALDGDYPFEMLNHKSLKSVLPNIGPEVAGASYTPMDGHANPLKLLRALHAASQRQGVDFRGGRHTTRIARLSGGGYEVEAGGERFHGARVVLAAGLGTKSLARQIGLNVPVEPNRGQILVSERAAKFLDYPTTYVRQTDEGTIQLGDSMEDVGLDDGTTADVLGAIARRGVRTFPVLDSLRLVRAWGSLRVMTPDGLPIYQESTQCPGASVVTCHSGVTLAPIHVFSVAPWLVGGAAPTGVGVFSGNRFLAPELEVNHVN